MFNKLFGDDDKNNFNHNVNNVIKLNSAIKKSLKSIYNKKGKDYYKINSNISFCSKYLHFANPDSGFIIDQFASKGSNEIFKILKKSNKCINNNFNDFIEQRYKNIDSSTKDGKETKSYLRHAFVCYVLAFYLFNNKSSLNDEYNSLYEKHTIPRLVDSFLVEIGKNKDKYKNKLSNIINIVQK